MNQEEYAYEYEAGKTAPIPAGFIVKQKTGESSEEADLTIVNAQNDEYVWIEVPQTAAVYANAGLNITNYEAETEIGGTTKTNYEWIRDDLKTYTASYANSDWNDYWYYRVGPDGSNYTTYSKDPLTGKKYERTGTSSEGGTLQESTESIDETNATGCGLTYAEYTRLYKAMLRSVYEKGGFYIGKYEAGTDTASYSNTGITGVNAVTRQDKIPIIYVTCSEAQKLASRVNSGSMNSSLMFGLQWDLVLKYLESKGASEEELKGTTTGSTGWGNYRNAEFDIERGKYETLIQNGSNYVLSGTWKDYDEDTAEYVESEVKKATTTIPNGVVLLTTGATSRNQKQGIYDLAGNVWEWTLESSSYVAYSCSSRGGGFGNVALSYPVCFRGRNTPTYSSYDVGYRVTLY